MLDIASHKWWNMEKKNPLVDYHWKHDVAFHKKHFDGGIEYKINLYSKILVWSTNWQKHQVDLLFRDPGKCFGAVLIYMAYSKMLC